MNDALPAWMKDAEVLGNWLAAHVKAGRSTNERLNQVSRADAVCWFIMKAGGLAKAKEVKRFAAAFLGRRKEPCWSLLNTCYGGVGVDFEGRLHPTWYSKQGENAYKHYGAVAPLYRPIERHYAPTADGFRRAARVEALVSA